MGWHYLDSGALYRIIGYAAFMQDIDVNNEADILALINISDIAFKDGAMLNAENIESEIRSEAAGDRASRVAKHPKVRAALRELQHQFEQPPGLVADGRDMGTTIFPQAPFKFYLIADAKERAKRRSKQLLANGQDGNIAALFRDIHKRDERDMNREDSPLCAAVDAMIIDTTHLSIEGVLDKVIDQLPFEVAI